METVFSLKGFTVTALAQGAQRGCGGSTLGFRTGKAGLNWPCLEQKAGLDVLQR